MTIDRNESVIEMIREQTERKMGNMMQAGRAQNAQPMNAHAQPMNAHAPSTPVPSNYDIAQTYLLLHILDALKDIGARLDTIDKEMWTRNNP